MLGDIIFTSNGEEVTYKIGKQADVEEKSEIFEWVVNKNSGKFHKPHCSSVGDMKEENKLYLKETRESVLKKGYTPCGVCKG